MEITQLEQMTKEEVFNFIRKRLSFGPEIKRQLKHVDEDDFSKEHRRFEMSGCEQTTGWCTLFNTAILNEFANLGIYDYTSYLFLDFDKGTPTVYLKYYDENENLDMILTVIQRQKSYSPFLNSQSFPEDRKDREAKT